MGRNRKHGKTSQFHFAALPIEFPYTLDLNERAQIRENVYGMIGGFVMGLLANYEPLEIAISLQNLPAVHSERQQALMKVYWRKTEGDENIHIFRDMLFPASCLECGQVHEEGKCPILIRAQNPGPSQEDEPLSETQQS